MGGWGNTEKNGGSMDGGRILIFGSLGSWVKYGGNMEGVGKCVEGVKKGVGEAWNSVCGECKVRKIKCVGRCGDWRSA